MFPFYKQYTANDCGPACLKMIIKHYNKNISIQSLRELCYIEREGVSINAIKNAGEKIGLKSSAIKSTIDKTNGKDYPALEELLLPLIAYWDNRHFIVIYKISNGKVHFADPAKGFHVMTLADVKKYFYSENDFGKVIIFEPTDFFYDAENPYFKNNILSNKLKFLSKHLFSIKKQLLILFSIIFIRLIVQSVSPFLAQKTFDGGILNKNLNILMKVLLIQIFIFLFTSVISYFQSISSNIISRKINFSFTNEFIKKIFKIPISFFQQKKSSDFIYRVNDLNKLESFLTYNMTSILLSLLSFIVYTIIAIYYNLATYLIFLSYSLIYMCWITYSLRKKKELNYEKFDIQVSSHMYLTEMIEGMYEIKLNGNENSKIHSLVNNQKRYFVNDLKNTKTSQFLSIGGGLISNLGYGITTFYTAYLTIDGTLTIGQMAAVQLIISQLNSLVSSISLSTSTVQEIKYSLERVLEIHSIKNEDSGTRSLNSTSSIVFKNVNFSYTEISDKVIKGVNLTIDAHKITAMVGISGSGKTTLMKLALGLCKPTSGNVYLDEMPLDKYILKDWRKKCGVVMQDGYMFTDSIINNVTESEEEINFDNYIKALKLACLYDFVISLPIQHNTIIGKGGLALSSGQRQRILIARMIYKDPDYIFMDEATNSLDTETERNIINNLNDIFSRKTRLIIAHRLNTVINADKIIVLSNGLIVEEGSHYELINKEGYYFELVKEQLQLS